MNVSRQPRIKAGVVVAGSPVVLSSPVIPAPSKV
jgi:hypothetical protein